jgi:hypothetical protein
MTHEELLKEYKAMRNRVASMGLFLMRMGIQREYLDWLKARTSRTPKGD